MRSFRGKKKATQRLCTAYCRDPDARQALAARKMVFFKFIVIPLLFLSSWVNKQSTAASKFKSISRPKSVPKLAGLRAMSSSESGSLSKFKNSSGLSQSRSDEVKLSALTLELCPETPSLQNGIMVEVIGEKDKDGRGATVSVGNSGRSPYTVQIGDSYPQKTIKKIKISGGEDKVVCVQSFVVDVTIMIDQPTEFKKTCPETPDVDDPPCKEFDEAVLTPFVCPTKLTELLQSKKQIKSVPEDMPTDYTPPVYDITNDMLQASAAIADGVTEGFGKIVKNRIKVHKAALKSKPLGKIASVVESVGSFIGALGPVFSIFAGIASIITSFLTPNPFDELAKYMDKQFDLVHERLTDIQDDIADLARLLEAQGSTLAMAPQIRAIRYAVRNYGSMVDRLAAEPVCGKRSLLNLREVDVFIKQYSEDRVDNSLIDLYEVDFGGVTEAGQGLLKPYAKAYCNSHPDYLGKFANELSFYGYAGTLAHFAYRNLDCLKRGKEDCDESEEDRNEWVTRLHKFLKKAEVFKVAAYNPPAALYLDVKDEIEKLIDGEVKKVSPTTKEIPGLLDKVYTFIIDKATNRNDWSNYCVLRVNGKDDGTHIVEVAEVSGFTFFDYNNPLNTPWYKKTDRERFYVEKHNTDRSYKDAGISCGHQSGGGKYCWGHPHSVPSTPPKDRVLFLMFNPKMYQAHYQYPSFIRKPHQTVFIDFRNVYAYYGDSGTGQKVYIKCWSACQTSWETQFAIIKK